MGFNNLLVISEKKYMGKIEGANVYMILAVEIFPFGQPNVHIRPYLDGIKKLMS